MELSFLGCGNAFSYELENNAATFKKGQDLFFIDMGEGIFQKVIHLNLLKDVKSVTIFITHMHLDHIGSLSEASVYPILFGLDLKDITIVYRDADKLRRWFKGLSDFKGIKFISEKEGNCHGVSFKAVKAKHGKNAYAYFLKDEDSFVFYSGDNAELNSEALELLKSGELDALYQDLNEKSSSYHLGLDSLKNMIPYELRNKIHVMHSPSVSFVEKAKAEGFAAALDKKMK